jgi:N-acetylmuramoyl-L-alanine amidase
MAAGAEKRIDSSRTQPKVAVYPCRMQVLEMLQRALTLSVALALVGCTGRSGGVADRPTPSSPASSSASSTANYGGSDVVWPILTRTTPAPPALGAVVTNAAGAPLTNGRVLQAGLTLPIVGGSSASPEVLTPCLTKVRLTGSGFTRIAPATNDKKIVVVDAGHGGRSTGAVAPDGTPESIRNLQVAELVRDELQGSVANVVMTRTTNRVVQLDFRVALADALRASFAISIHFNASPDGPSTHPGTTTFGSVADPNGRRAAGVIFEAERAYLDTLTPLLRGSWVSYKDAGALYRLGSRGDFYRHLRESHVTWVISEAMFISNEAESRLLARAAVRAGLAHAIATGVMRYLDTDAPGSGWRNPIDRGNPNALPDPRCNDPYV